MKTSIIKSNGVRDSTERKVIQNWAAENAKRELKSHKSKIPIDHPDGSVTTSKIADRAVAYVKLSDDVKRRFDDLSRNVGELAETDKALGRRIDTETAERKSQDSALSGRITDEARLRDEADGLLRTQISDETADRKNAVAAIGGRVTELEAKAHIHANKPAIDEITAERMKRWDENTDFYDFKEFINDILGGLSGDIQLIGSLIGITVIDGSLFTQEYNSVSLDGGGFGDISGEPFNCGGFEPLSIGISTSAVTDGGIY